MRTELGRVLRQCRRVRCIVATVVTVARDHKNRTEPLIVERRHMVVTTHVVRAMPLQ